MEKTRTTSLSIHIKVIFFQTPCFFLLPQAPLKRELEDTSHHLGSRVMVMLVVKVEMEKERRGEGCLIFYDKLQALLTSKVCLLLEVWLRSNVYRKKHIQRPCL